MEKYENVSLDSMSRTKRNQDIYNSSDMSDLSRIKTNTNVSIISDAPKEIDIEKIKSYVEALNNEKEEKRKRVSLELPKEEETVVKRKEIKEYDINSILEKAKDNREVDYEEDRHRKLNNTQIDILKNIKIREEKIEEIDPDITGPIDELNTDEKTIVDLIQDIQNNSKNSKTTKQDLFSDLMGDSTDTVVMAPIEEEVTKDNIKEALLNITQDLESIKQPENDFTHEISIEKNALKDLQNIEITKDLEDLEKKQDEPKTESVPKINEVDKSFYTNSMTFNKSDFEGFEELEKGVKKSNTVTKLAIGFIVLLLIATIILILNFVFDWNII